MQVTFIADAKSICVELAVRAFQTRVWYFTVVYWKALPWAEEGFFVVEPTCLLAGDNRLQQVSSFCIGTCTVYKNPRNLFGYIYFWIFV